MITAIAGLFIKRLGADPKVARIAAWVFLIAALVIVLSVAKCTYDKGVVDDALKEINIETEKADRKADNNAAEQRGVDQSRAVQERQELEEVNAKVDDPVERRAARYRCIELQRTARAEGRKPPSCL